MNYDRKKSRHFQSNVIVLINKLLSRNFNRQRRDYVQTRSTPNSESTNKESQASDIDKSSDRISKPSLKDIRTAEL